MKKLTLPVSLFLTWLLIIATGCIKKDIVVPQEAAESRPVEVVLKNNFAFSMFYQAMVRTGLDKTITAEGDFTILVPDNDAFANSGITADSLSRMDDASLKTLLGYHIFKEKITYAAIPQAIDRPYKSIAGPVAYFSVPVPNRIFNNPVAAIHVNGVLVKTMDIAAKNGVVQVLEKVLDYPALSIKAVLEGDPDYSYFTQALRQFGLLDQLDKAGPYVLLAPDNDAFSLYGIDEAVLHGIDSLKYRKFVFNTCILYNQLFFFSDFQDATPLLPYVTPDVVLEFNRGTAIQAFPLNYIELNNAGLNNLIFGDQSSNITDPDHLALNGVLQGINNLLIIPDSVKVR